MTTTNKVAQPLDGALGDVLAALLLYVDRETCVHDETHRGGCIWTICDSCGRKWADDSGGFIPHTDAPEVAAARSYLEFMQQPVTDAPVALASGLTIRQHFEGLAMQGILASDSNGGVAPNRIATWACEYADALLAALASDGGK